MNAMPVMPLLTHGGGALIASPDSALREQILHRLNGRCRPVQQALGGADALAKLEMGDWQVLFLDRRLPDLDAEELIAIIQVRFPGTQVVMLDSDGAGSLHPVGDYASDDPRDCPREDQSVAAPHDSPTLLTLVQQPPDLGKAAVAHPLPGMIGTSPAMQRVYRMVRLVASRTTTVLIAGPTGTGKELVARALHTLSPRSAKRWWW
jgi:DNA-binding NtrC family response regulator